MINTNLSILAIRFKGCTKAWEQRELGEIYTERNERGNDSLKILSVSIHHGVSNEELGNNTLGKKVRRSEDKTLYKHVYFGDLVLNMMRAWQGAIGVSKSEAMVSPAYITAIPSAQLYPLFMDCYLRTDKMIGQMNNLSYGVTDFRKRLYWDSFIKVECYIPTVFEQERITSFFNHFDRRIDLHKQQLDNFTEFKKVILLKIFNRELRFKDDGGKDFPEWDEICLGMVGSLLNGYAFKSNEYSSDGKYKVVTISNVTGKRYADTSKTNRMNSLPLNIQEHQMLEKGDILISLTGNVVRVSMVNDENCVLNQRVGLLKLESERVNHEYIYQYLKNGIFEAKMIQSGQGAAQANISKGNIEEYDLLLPCKKEQLKISKLLFELEEKTLTIEMKILKLRELKKGLIQQTLV
ncbi:restriction endonuclease subunit S [Trichococcus alkaliphilus]|uniref:restriction endonuclease subunit S n=1 Tax=Trichococcus alkaliphilus TaxID=2052943 RepID=UPI000D0AE7E2|nr:restriction endonuclease subunit S [Trichococcus alkaliphilus]